MAEDREHVRTQTTIVGPWCVSDVAARGRRKCGMTSEEQCWQRVYLLLELRVEVIEVVEERSERDLLEELVARWVCIGRGLQYGRRRRQSSSRMSYSD